MDSALKRGGRGWAREPGKGRGTARLLRWQKEEDGRREQVKEAQDGTETWRPSLEGVARTGSQSSRFQRRRHTQVWPWQSVTAVGRRPTPQEAKTTLCAPNQGPHALMPSPIRLWAPGLSQLLPASCIRAKSL